MRPSSCSAPGTEPAYLTRKDKVAGPTLEAGQVLAEAAGTKASGSPAWQREAIIADKCEHPQSIPGADRHPSFAAKVFFAVVVAIVAEYVTARLL